jgi:hypothetical protein
MTRGQNIKRIKDFAFRAVIGGFFCLYLIPLVIWLIYPNTTLSEFLVFLVVFSYVGFVILSLPILAAFIISNLISSVGIHRVGDGRFEELCSSPFRWFIWDELRLEAETRKSGARTSENEGQ